MCPIREAWQFMPLDLDARLAWISKRSMRSVMSRPPLSIFLSPEELSQFKEIPAEEKLGTFLQPVDIQRSHLESIRALVFQPP